MLGTGKLATGARSVRGSAMPPGGRASVTDLRLVFKGSIWKKEPGPWEISTFKGHFEVKISDGSGIWDPRIEIVRIEIIRTDRTPQMLTEVTAVRMPAKTMFASAHKDERSNLCWERFQGQLSSNARELDLMLWRCRALVFCWQINETKIDCWFDQLHAVRCRSTLKQRRKDQEITKTSTCYYRG